MPLENKTFSVKNGLSVLSTEVISNDRKLKNLTIDTSNSNVLKINGNQLTASAGNSTLTLPNATDTLVGRNTTDTLLNKTLTNVVVTGTLAVNGDAGDNGQILKSTGTGIVWSDVFAGIPQYIPQNSNFQAEAGGVYIVDSSGSSLTITMPDTTNLPIGQSIEFVDAKGSWSSNFVTLISGPSNDLFLNAANIEDDTLIFDVSNAIVRIVWDGSFWKVFAK